MDQEQLDRLTTELKVFISKHDEERKTLGAATQETKAAVTELQKQVDALDLKLQKQTQAQTTEKPLIEELKENDDVMRIVRGGRGTARISIKGGIAALQRKTTITSAAVGSGTAGVLMPEMLPGLVQLALARPVMRNVLPAAPTNANAVFYVKENAWTSAASPQVETSPKGESALTFTTVSAAVQTLAHWIPVAKQVLDDFEGLAAEIRGKLLYGLRYLEDLQILSGSGSGQDLDGLITQGTAYNTALQSATKGWNKIDQIRIMIEQNQIANNPPIDFVVLNPTDWADIELTKDSYGRYIVGNPNSMLPYTLWGRTIIVTTAITAGTFLAGVSTEAQLRDRMEATVEISTEHSDYFAKNMVAVRAEERLALVCFRPTAFLHGSFNTSPA